MTRLQTVLLVLGFAVVGAVVGELNYRRTQSSSAAGSATVQDAAQKKVQVPEGMQVLPLTAEPFAAQAILKALTEAGLVAQYNESDKSVWVEEGREQAALDALALAGILPGSEQFDLSDIQADPEKSPEDYKRQKELALQNSLSSMISMFGGVQACSVRILEAKDTKPVRAEVRLRLDGSMTRSLQKQIVDSVAGVVEDLQPANVALLDESGNALELPKAIDLFSTPAS